MNPLHGSYSTLLHPTPAEVGLVDDSPREIILVLGEGFEVELWPGAEDHDEQEAWLDTVEDALRLARGLMRSHREPQHPESAGETEVGQ